MSAQAKQRLVSALVSLAKSTRGGYDGLRASGVSGGRKRRAPRRGGNLGVTNLRASGGSLSGGALSGGRKRRPRRAGNLGVVNLSASGGALSGGRRRRGCGTSGGRGTVAGASKNRWLKFVNMYRDENPNLSYGEVLKLAGDEYRQIYGTKKSTKKRRTKKRTARK